MLTKEQLEQRINYLCGTDIAAILGVSPYKTAMQVWMEKTRRVVAEDISDRPSIKAGNYLEYAIGKWFEAETGKELRKDIDIPDMIIHPTIPFLAGNIDRYLAEEKAILEIKTSQSDAGWGEGFDKGDNRIPDHYLCQVAHYVACTNVERAYIAVLIRGIDFRYFIYERDLELEVNIIAKEIEFWENCIIKDEPPAPQNPNDVVILFENKVSDENVIANDDIRDKIDELKNIKQQIKSLEDKEKSLKTDVCAYMQDKQTLLNINGDVVVTWKMSADSNKFDDKLLKEQMPEVYNKFLKIQKGSRRFLIK